MSTAHSSNDSKKRKQTENSSKPQNASKKPRPDGTHSLIGPHETIIAELSPNYDVLAASIISSTQIHKRVTNITLHLLRNAEKPQLALLHARTADVCKMITVVEQCKRVLGEQGEGAWYQYNQLFDLPAQSKRKNMAEETVLEREVEHDADSESDAFEFMESRFENAVLPPPRTRTYKSMRIFLSLKAVQELNSRQDVTVQLSEEA